MKSLKDPSKIPGNALSDALLTTHIQIFAANAAGAPHGPPRAGWPKEIRAARDFFFGGSHEKFMILTSQ